MCQHVFFFFFGLQLKRKKARSECIFLAPLFDCMMINLLYICSWNRVHWTNSNDGLFISAVCCASERTSFLFLPLPFLASSISEYVVLRSSIMQSVSFFSDSFLYIADIILVIWLRVFTTIYRLGKGELFNCPIKMWTPRIVHMKVDCSNLMLRR